MSSGVNQVILVGHLGSDPELKSTPTGRQVAEFRMATSRKWNDAQGQLKEATEWHRVKVWGRMAESVARFLHKGRQVFVEGRIETRKWVDKEGHDRFIHEIIARQVVFLGGGRQNGAARPEPGADEEDRVMARMTVSEPAGAWRPDRRLEEERWRPGDSTDVDSDAEPELMRQGALGQAEGEAWG